MKIGIYNIWFCDNSNGDNWTKEKDKEYYINKIKNRKCKFKVGEQVYYNDIKQRFIITNIVAIIELNKKHIAYRITVKNNKHKMLVEESDLI